MPIHRATAPFSDMRDWALTFLILSCLFSFSAAVTGSDLIRQEVDAQFAEGDNGPSYCRFAVQDLRFDLCPLDREQTRRITIKEETPPTVTTSIYSLRLSGALKRNESWPDEYQVSRSLRCSSLYTLCLNSLPRVFSVRKAVGFV